MSNEREWKIADLVHDVHIGSGGLISFLRWLIREGRHERLFAFLFLRRGILVCIFDFSWSAKEGRSFGRFRSLNCLRLTDGELGFDLVWGQGVSGIAQPPISRLSVNVN